MKGLTFSSTNYLVYFWAGILKTTSFFIAWPRWQTLVDGPSSNPTKEKIQGTSDLLALPHHPQTIKDGWDW